MKKYTAELLGTFVLTLFGCGSAAIAGAALGTLGIAFAFGLSIVAMAYAIGDISGCHINPAVSLGVWMSGKMTTKDFFGYVVAQCVGALLAALTLAAIINMTNLGGIAATGLGANGYGAASSIGLTACGALVVEAILTCIFVLTILGYHGHPAHGYLRQPGPQFWACLGTWRTSLVPTVGIYRGAFYRCRARGPHLERV